MRRVPIWVWGLVVIVLAVAGGLGLGVLSSRNAGGDNVTEAKVTPPVQPTITQPVAPDATVPPVTVVHTPTQNLTPAVAADPSTNGDAAQRGGAAWEQKLDEVLLSNAEAPEKTEKLLQLLPTLDENGQVEVSQHLVNFVTDDNYNGVAAILTNSATAESVDSIFMNDLLNRNDALKLPLLLDMAKDDSHPKHAEARDLLELFLQDNYGTDWGKWEQSITNYLTNNGQVAADTSSTPAPEPAQ